MKRAISFMLTLVMIISIITSIPVTVSAQEEYNEIESVSFSLAAPVVLYGGFHTIIDVYEDGNCLTINYKNGETVKYIFEFSEDNGYNAFWNDEGENLNGSLSYNEGNVQALPIGEHFLTFSYEDYETGATYPVDIPVSVIENPVESISLELSSEIEFIEGERGYFEEDDGEKYYTYEPCLWDIPYDSILTINYKDGTAEAYTFVMSWSEEDMQYYPEFISESGKVLKGWDYEFSTNEKNEPWTPGINYFEFSVFGVSAQVPVLLKGTNVESISVEIVTPLVVNEQLYTDFYCIDPLELGKNGNKVIIQYKDGKKIAYTWNDNLSDEGSSGWIDSDGNLLEYKITTSVDDSGESWIVGNTYENIVSCCGKTTMVPVTLIGCGHEWTSEGCFIEEPTCDSTGLRAEYCKKCGLCREVVLPKIDHNVSEWVIKKEATCIESGSKYGTCDMCLSSVTKIIPATGHKVVKDLAVKATCTKAGKTEGSHCSVCKAVIEAQKTVAKKGHTASDWIVSKKATVNAAGSKYQKCTVCGVKIKTAKIAQLKCATPKLKAVTNVATGIKFTWNKVTGGDNYEIYRKTGSGAWKKVATVKGTVTTYTDKTAKSGTTYKYTVKAKNEAGVSKYNTTGLTIKCLADPVLQTPTSTKKGITLKWNKIKGAQGYVVYRKAGNGKLTKLVTVKGVSKISYTDKSAKKGTKYTYQIKAYSGKTYSAYSNSKTIKCKF